MYLKRHRVTIQATVADAATQAFYSDYIVNGALVEAIHYRPDTASGLSTAAHLVISGEISGVVILACTATGEGMHYPRAAAQSTAGAALTYASDGGGAIMPVKIPIAQERVKVEVSSAGASAATDYLGAVVDLYLTGV